MTIILVLSSLMGWQRGAMAIIFRTDSNTPLFAFYHTLTFGDDQNAFNNTEKNTIMEIESFL